MQKLRNTDCKTIFEDSTLRVLKEWHKKYGIVASLYVMGDLAINSHYAKELIEKLEAHDRMLDTENNIYFIKTDFRLEHIKERFGNVANLIKYYNSKRENELIVFSHEWNFRNHLQECDSIFS